MFNKSQVSGQKVSQKMVNPEENCQSIIFSENKSKGFRVNSKISGKENRPFEIDFDFSVENSHISSLNSVKTPIKAQKDTSF